MKKYKNLYKTLGRKSAKLISFLARDGQSVFSIKEAAKILETDNYKVRELLSGLVKKGWLLRLEKGKFLVIPLSIDANQPYTENQFIIASKLAPVPYYIGFWSALNYYGYTEQLSNTVFVATSRRKREINIAGVSYRFVTVAAYKIFGLAEIKISTTPVQFSDKEKTIVDCLDHLEYCGGITEVAKGIWGAKDGIDFQRLMSYTGNMKNSAIAKRLGYLAEVFGLNKQVKMKELQKMLSSGYSCLDPTLPKKGQYSSRWRLLVNIPIEELLSVRKV
jgi:predicted transcriptional regulator of viral defense system